MTGLHLAQYRIDAEIGRGGMGIVYRATDTKLNRAVALKVLPAAALSSEEDRARFFREAQAAAQLNHPNVCHVYQVDEAIPTDTGGAPAPGQDGKRPFIAMEFIEGETLQERIRKGPLKLTDAVKLAAQVAEALRAAHAKNIVHRDIKSANVMLTSEGVAKVLDFGLAKTNQSTMLTRMGSTLGTVAYMSPEQARGQEVDGRSDLYSLGTVMYEMIAGRLPFAADYEQAVVYGILNESPEPLTSLRTGVPVGLEWIVDKLLAKEPRHRYQTAADLVADLETVDLGGSGLSRRTMKAAGTTGMAGTAVSPTVGAVLPNRGGFWASVPRWVWGIVAGAVVVGVVGGVLVAPRFRAKPVRQTMVVSVPVPIQGSISHPSISPDARFLAFSSGGNLQLHDLREGATREVSETRLARLSRFSPDERWLVYEDGTGLSIMQLPDGVPARLSEVGNTPSWIDEEWIAFSNGGGIYRISRVTQRTEALWEPDATDSIQLDHPFVLPGRKKALVSVMDSVGASVGLLDLSSRDVRRLVAGAVAPFYVSSGHLLYTEQPDAVNYAGRLFAQPFDADRGETRGPAVPVLSTRGYWEVGVSSDGDLVTSGGIETGTTAAQFDFAWIDPETSQLTRIDRHVSDLRGMGLSPDGGTLWYKSGPEEALFVDRVDATGASPLELVRNGFGSAHLGVGGDSLYFHKGAVGAALQTWVRSTNGASAERRRSFFGEPFEGIWDLSPDGRTAVVVSGDTWDTEEGDFYLASLEDGSSRALPIPMNAYDIKLSPDRRWVVYQSQRGPEWHVISTDGAGPWRLETGLAFAQWMNDSKSLLMRDATAIYEVGLSMDRGVRLSGSRTVVYRGTTDMQYTVDRATGRVLVADRMVVRDGSEPRLDLILAWGERLKREAPVQ